MRDESWKLGRLLGVLNDRGRIDEKLTTISGACLHR